MNASIHSSTSSLAASSAFTNKMGGKKQKDPPPPPPIAAPARTPASESAGTGDIERKKQGARKGLKSSVLAPYLGGEGGGRDLLG